MAKTTTAPLAFWPAVASRGTTSLPQDLPGVTVPPLKCQGIKTKLVRRIAESVSWDGTGRWIEPFMGSGVVAMNIRPRRALLVDANVHVVRFYIDLQSGSIDPGLVRTHLEREGRLLSRSDGSHYYLVRDRFNQSPSSLDYLFLNRSCFNGLVRFNRSGGFNVPFCRKPNRFSPAMVTKVVNQVARTQAIVQDSDWTFLAADWQEAIASCQPEDFVYADPPYEGRFSDYLTSWSRDQDDRLYRSLAEGPSDFAISTWVENHFRKNLRIEPLPSGCRLVRIEHHYHLGATESLRHPMVEGLIIRDGTRRTSRATLGVVAASPL